MTSNTQTSKISALMDQFSTGQASLDHSPSGMHFLRYSDTTVQDATLYRPLLCLVLQGTKEVATGNRMLTVSDGQSLLVSHTLPVMSRITKASPERPYIALVLPIDFELLRQLAPNASVTPAATPYHPFSISLCPTDQDLEGAILRYLDQCAAEPVKSLLAPITLREIHARLLLGPHGDQLHKLLWHETTASRVFRATNHIQTNLSDPLVIADLAQRAGMSQSAFFEHFKSVTGTSPLQYQKDLRLLRARDTLRNSNEKISEIAFSLGYDSPSQFSREYTRKFGSPPKQERMLPTGATR